MTERTDCKQSTTLRPARSADSAGSVSPRGLARVTDRLRSRCRRLLPDDPTVDAQGPDRVRLAHQHDPARHVIERIELPVEPIDARARRALHDLGRARRAD